MIDDSMGYATGGSSASTTVTGFFDSRTEAESAAERLRALGLGGRVQVTEGAGGSGLTDTSGSADTIDNRGFWDRLGDFFFPEDDRSTYAEGLSRGGYLVTVMGLTSEQYDLAMDALEDAGAVDIDERAESWRSEGWSGATGGMAAGSLAAGGMTGGSTTTGASGGMSGAGAGAGFGGASDTGETIPVVEERLRVGKRDVSHGRVRVRSYVVEEPVSETVHLEDETVEVERRPVDRAVAAGDELFRERSIEAEEHREEAVIQKEARVVEEVALRRSHDSREETVSDTVRRTEVEVDDGRGVSGSASGSRSGEGGMTEYEAQTGRPDDEDDDDATGLTDRR